MWWKRCVYFTMRWGVRNLIILESEKFLPHIFLIVNHLTKGKKEMPNLESKDQWRVWRQKTDQKHREWEERNRMKNFSPDSESFSSTSKIISWDQKADEMMKREVEEEGLRRQTNVIREKSGAEVRDGEATQKKTGWRSQRPEDRERSEREEQNKKEKKKKMQIVIISCWWCMRWSVSVMRLTGIIHIHTWEAQNTQTPSLHPDSSHLILSFLAVFVESCDSCIIAPRLNEAAKKRSEVRKERMKRRETFRLFPRFRWGVEIRAFRSCVEEGRRKIEKTFHEVQRNKNLILRSSARSDIYIKYICIPQLPPPSHHFSSHPLPFLREKKIQSFACSSWFA